MANKQVNLFSFFGSKNQTAPETAKRKNTDAESNEINENADTVKSRKLDLRKFKNEWLIEFKWLRHEERDGNELLFCEICESVKKQNGFTKGCVNMKKSAIKEHRDSSSHHHALSLISIKKQMEKHMSAANDKSDEKLTAMLRTVLFMAQENIPANKFTKLIKLQQENGCLALQGEVYTHSDSVEEMENALVQSTIESLKTKIDTSDFVGIIIDETVNVSVEKKLILFLRLYNSGKSETIFLGNFTVYSGTAQCIFDKINEVLSQWNIPLKKVVGLASDGASVMTGRLNGVGARLKTTCPGLIHVHCIAHRVSLASQDAARVTKVVSEYRRTLNEIYKLYEYSATRYNRLRELCDVLDGTNFASVKQPCSVRWLSLGRAVRSTKQIWPALVLEIEEEASERKNNVAINIQRTIKTYSFTAMTYMLCDVLSYMDKLITLFQRENVHLGMIKTIVNSTIESLRGLLTNLGENEEHFKENVEQGVFRGITLTYADERSVAAYEKSRNGFIEELVQSLQGRFPNESLDVLTCLDNLFNPSHFPKSQTDLAKYGVESLNRVLEHFSPIIGQTENDVMSISVDRAKKDFTHFKYTVYGLGARNLEEVCKLISTEYEDLYPDFSVLAKIILTLPVSSVAAERGFSLQNRIHTASRNRLSEQRSNNLMTLSLHAEYCCAKRAGVVFRNKNRKF